MKKSLSYPLAFITILLFTSSTSTIIRMDRGEPVIGAEVFVEQEPNDEPIANGFTDQDGSFSFSFPPGMKIPKKLTISIKIKFPEYLSKNVTPIPCQLKIIAGGKTYSKNITYLPTAKSMSGPYHSSYSNMEENAVFVIKLEIKATGNRSTNMSK